jgi:hypothetical protein
VHRPGKAKATVQHFCTTFQLSTVARQGSPPRNSGASTPTPSQGFCVSSPAGRSASLRACAILVQFLQDTVHRYMRDRSLMPCLSLIAASRPFFRRVLDHRESVPWFTATPCIVAGHGSVHEYQRSLRKPACVNSSPSRLLQRTADRVQRTISTTRQMHVYNIAMEEICACASQLHIHVLLISPFSRTANGKFLKRSGISLARSSGS